MKIVKFIILVLILVVLQYSAGNFLQIRLAIPNLFLIGVFCLFFMEFGNEVIFVVIFGGLLLDLLNSTNFGSNFISLAIIVGGLQAAQKYFEISKIPIFILLIFPASIICDAVYFFDNYLFGIHLQLFDFWKIILFTAIYNMILILVIFPIVIFVNRKLFPNQNKEYSLELMERT